MDRSHRLSSFIRRVRDIRRRYPTLTRMCQNLKVAAPSCTAATACLAEVSSALFFSQPALAGERRREA